MSKLCVLVTGGAGFLGSHAATHWVSRKWRVIVIDDLSHPGSKQNLKQLKELPGLSIVQGDINNPKTLSKALSLTRRVDVVFHAALKRADSESFKDPQAFFNVNVSGTFRILETFRRFTKGKRPHLIIFPSTRKVYGNLASLKIRELDRRYRYDNATEAVNETQPLSFEGPYSCSMGTAEQYVHDYSRIYRLPTVALRLSTIYGPQHYATQEQGWVTYMAICAFLGKPIAVFGNGKQVRDLLYVEDLMRLLDNLFENRDVSAGGIYNVGGGGECSMSVLELIDALQNRLGKKLKVKHVPVRRQDQQIYISDISTLRQKVGWYPKVSIDTGLDRTLSWIKTHQDLIERVLLKKSNGILS